MKQILMMALVAVSLSASANTPEINEKVLKAFRETFRNATEVVWHEKGETVQANFKQASITTRAEYDQEGNLLTTLRYYGEDNLPAHILAKLRKKYAAKTIFGVTEITKDDQTTYYVKLVDDKHWITIKSDTWGSFEQTEKYKKS